MSTDTREGTRRDSRPIRALTVIVRFEGVNRLRITAVIAVLFALYGAMFVLLGPELIAGDAMADLIDAMPPTLNELLGFESLASLEGLLASEFYTFGWIVGFSGYVAYSAAGTVAGDLRDERLDTLLASPVSRHSVLLGKFLALLVPIGVLSVFVPLWLWLVSLGLDQSIALSRLAAFHLLSLPYLLLWSAIGVLIGVVVRRGRTAGRVTLGLVFAGWIFEAFISTTGYAWVGGISPMRYLDPAAVLVEGSYDVVAAGILFAGTLVVLGLGLYSFHRADF